MEAAVGKKYHGITLRYHCGSGAYGDVYCGEDISGRRLAVKVVSKSKLGDVWARELKGVVNYRKITEKSPELLQIFHVEDDEDSFFYTMEAADSVSAGKYIPDTLAARLRKGPLGENVLLRILTEILNGIRTLHHAGFAHRDIKPDNILFVNGIPKLGDIGLLSSLDTTMTQIAGTMDFLPPEVRIADGKRAAKYFSRPKNDLYAFGKVIYCCVTGGDPREWPAIPEKLPLTLPLKLFLQLSFRLCDRDVLCRLSSMDKVEKEFRRIGRLLARGETLAAKISYFLHRSATLFHCELMREIAWCVHHGFLCFFLLLMAGGFLWLWRQDMKTPLAVPPELPVPVKTVPADASPEITFPADTPLEIAAPGSKYPAKVFHSGKLGISLMIPADWEIASQDTVRALLEEKYHDTDMSREIEKKRYQLLQERLLAEGGFIYCDYDPVFADNIVIHPLTDDVKEYFDLADDALRLRMQQFLRQELGYDSRIDGIRRMTVKEVPCIEITFSTEREKSRILHYIFRRDDRPFSITLTAKEKTYPELVWYFKAALATLEFDKKE